MDEQARPQRRSAARVGRPAGRVLGIPLRVSPSVLLLALLVTFSYGGYVRQELSLTPAAGYAVGLGFVACLLVSVLLHELGHALTARRFGIGVRGITLELLGGYTEMDRDAPSPKVDLLVSVAGPAVSLGIGAVASALAWASPDRTLIDQLAFQVAVANLLVAAFNLLPGLPLDGGRALRAAVWAASRDRHLATEVAGWCGRGIAALTAALVFVFAQVGALGIFGMVFLMLVAFTLWQGAGQSIRLARISRRFTLVDLGQLARPVLPVPSGTPLAEAQRRGVVAAQAQPRGAGGSGPGGSGPVVGGPGHALAVADSSGRLVALIDRIAADAVPAERRPWVSVDSVARDVTGIHSLPLGLTGEQVVRAVQAHPGPQYLVTAGEDVVGVLHVADLARLLEPRRRGR